MALRKVTPGDPFQPSAEAWNAFIDAAMALKAGQLDAEGAGLGYAAAWQQAPIRNDSGADRARYEVLGIKGVLFTPTDNEDHFKNRLVFRGERPALTYPATDDFDGRWAILLEPIAAGDMGRCLLAGVCPVKIDVTDATLRRADAVHNVCEYLRTCQAGGAQILWKESGTGTKWALVRLPGRDGGLAAGTIRSGLLRCDLTAGYACVVEETYSASSPGTWDDQLTGKTYYAFDRLGEFYGAKDETGCLWTRYADTPTQQALIDAGITLPSGAPTPTESDVIEIIRVTCPGFVYQCGQ